MQVERFIREYANSQKKSISNYALMKEECKEKAYMKINNALSARERGLITVDEAIRCILNCFE